MAIGNSNIDPFSRKHRENLQLSVKLFPKWVMGTIPMWSFMCAVRDHAFRPLSRYRSRSITKENEPKRIRSIDLTSGLAERGVNSIILSLHLQFYDPLDLASASVLLLPLLHLTKTEQMFCLFSEAQPKSFLIMFDSHN